LPDGHSSGSGPPGRPGPRSLRPRGHRGQRTAIAAAAALAVALTVSLGNWQMRRAQEKAQLQARRDAAERSAPLSIPATPADAASLDGRRVSVRGRYLADRTVFVDNRTYKGVAGFHVVTPVKIENSQLHVLVLRGWVARDPRERERLPTVRTPQDVVQVEGYGQAAIDPSLELKQAAPPAAQERIWQNLDFERYERWSGLRLQPLVLRQAAAPPVDDGLVRDWPVAGSDVDKHRGYALQWYSMAAVTAGLWVYFTFFRRRGNAFDAS